MNAPPALRSAGRKPTPADTPAIGPLIVLLTLDVGTAILTFAGLKFLGLGVIPTTPEWGQMVSEGRELVEQWWVATFPGIAILTVRHLVVV